MCKLSFILYLKTSVLCLIISNALFGQNLVFDGSFEDINRCKELNQPCSPAALFYINNNPLGYHKKKEPGNYQNYAIEFGGFPDSVYQYWETKMAGKLLTRKEYLLSFNVASLNSGLENYGFLFTAKFTFSTCDTVLNSSTFITMAGGNNYLISGTLITAIGKGISREYGDISKDRRVEILVFRKND